MWTLVFALGLAMAPASGEPRKASPPASGIEGQTVIRPVRSVTRKGEPNHAAYQAKITVLDSAGHQVAVVESDAAGAFRLSLPPGTYVLRPQSPGRYPRASEQTVVVKPGKLTRALIVYDSGRR